MTPSAETLKQRLVANPTVGLIGLGYVGLPLAVAFAESGATVIGVDLDARRVTAMRAGESFIEDVPAERLARPGRARPPRAPGGGRGVEGAAAAVHFLPATLGQSEGPA